jgi:DNA-directed RNA polymerase subunit RPC12/RpoP
MSGREYVCGECGHRFRTPDDAPRDVRALMCPSCGSIDLNIDDVRRPSLFVMRARGPAPIDVAWRGREPKAS